MIQQFIDILESIRFNMTAEQIADALWLAPHIELPPPGSIDDNIIYTPPPPPVEPPSEPGGGGGQANVTDMKNQLRQPDSPPDDETEPLSAKRPGKDSGSLDVFLPGSDKDSKKNRPGLAFSSPAAPALPGALEISRTLRPLMRRVPSRTQFVLDEEATVNRIVEEGLWIPVLQPAQEHWLEVALVVDEAASMAVWQQMIAELRLILERQGAFRDVRSWGLMTDAPDGKLRLHIGTGRKAQNERTREPLELIDPSGRRLILIVSDCVSPAWYNGSVAREIARWGRRSPLAIIQVLPKRLWPHTALGPCAAYLRTTLPGVPNTMLRAEQRKQSWDDDGADDGSNELLVPTITLDPQSLSPWANLIAGSGWAWALATALNTHPSQEHDQGVDDKTREEGSAISAEQLVKNFRRIASPMARELAGYLAAAPLSLQVMRLVQQAMLPQSKQVHLAEIFLSGLLEELPSNDGGNRPTDIRYEFVDGVRDELLKKVRVSDAEVVLKKVLDSVSDYVESRVGQALDFPTLIAAPKSKGQVIIPDESRPFATVTAHVLRRLGGQYAQMAEQLESGLTSDAPKPAPPTPVPLPPPEPVPDPVIHYDSSGLSEGDWLYLLRRISEGRCTPFIGPGANSDLMPSDKDLAQFLAKQYEYPLGDYYDLPLVTQYISVMLGDDKLRHSLSTQLAEWADSAELERQSPRAGIYEVMSQLPLPLYITTNFDGLMEKALLHSGKKADWRVCAWNRRLRRMAPSSELSPRADSPMVFHLHGHLNMPESLVLTEDDHDDLLIYMSRDQTTIPLRIQRALTGTSLVFTGIAFADFRWRILFRTLNNFIRRSLNRLHIAQIDPDSDQSRRRGAVGLFAERYFGRNDIRIYWGSLNSFSQELSDRWQQYSKNESGLPLM